MIEWELKVWGRTRELIYSPYYSKHELELLSHSYCSLHYHQRRANVFKVESGQVEIVELYGPKYRITTLTHGREHIVPSLVAHMFIVKDAGIMIEEYYPDRDGEVDRNDIIRFSIGGLGEINVLSEFLGKIGFSSV